MQGVTAAMNYVANASDIDAYLSILVWCTSCRLLTDNKVRKMDENTTCAQCYNNAKSTDVCIYTSIGYITYQQGDHAKRSRKEGVVNPLTQVDG